MSPSHTLRLGTRGSNLAQTQSRWVAAEIERRHGVEVELVTIRTSGDVLADKPLSEIGGKGVFTKELDVALLEGRIDLAVHSLKDLPTRLPDGIAIGAVPEREDPRDVLVVRAGDPSTIDSLQVGARVGTGSLRRVALARAHRPDLEVADIRGNIETRIAKVDRGEYDAVVLAAAGMHRAGLADRVSSYLDTGSWLPAPGQGALAVAVRSEDLEGIEWLRGLDHLPTRAAVTAERTILELLEAGCRLPVAAVGLPFGGGLRVRGLVADPEGGRIVRAEGTGAQDDPVALGRSVASALLARGADLILRDLEAASIDAPGVA